MKPLACCVLAFAAALVVAVNSSAVTQVLRDMEKMKHSSCSPGVIVPLEVKLTSSEWMPAAEVAVRISNFLTQVYTRSDPLTDQQLFSLVTSTLGGTSSILGCWIEFEPFAHRNRSSMAPYAVKLNGVTRQTMETDVGGNSPEVRLYRTIRAMKWDHLPMERLQLHEERSARVSANDSTQSVYPSVSVSSGQWTPPYFDCADINKWMVSYLVPFFRYVDGGVRFIGATGVDVDLTMTDINQCDDETAAVNETKLVNVFHGSHQCHPSTRCHFLKGQGFVRGAYQCRCLEGFYFPNHTQPQLALRTLYFSCIFH